MSTLRQNQFTPFSNIVISKGTVQVAPGTPIDALAGNDKITGIATDTTPQVFPGDIFGVYLQDRLTLSRGDDSLTGITYSAGNQLRVYAIVVGSSDGFAGIVDGGSGNDRITGYAESKQTGPESLFVIGISLFSSSQILTGAGHDLIHGRASGTAWQIYGIYLEEESVIDTGSGNDRVIGTATNTIYKEPSSGIFGDTTCLLSTGDGHDQVIGTASVAGDRLFGILGGLTIDLGSGNDLLKGFGPFKAFGGSGKDTYNLLGYSTTDFEITKHGQGKVTLAGFNPVQGFTATAELTDFEVFIFNNGIFSYDTLG